MLAAFLFLAQATAPALLDQARSLPPEFSADTMLRLAASRFAAEPKRRRELIEEAFVAGGHAQLVYPRALDGMAADSRPSLEFHRNDLEALTLQTRAVKAMLSIDPARALAMFRDIPRLLVLPDGGTFV